MWTIQKDGFFFRAVNQAERSPLFTSASQAGGYIGRKAGPDAHRTAAEAFIGGAK